MTYTTDTFARALGVRPARVRQMVEAGLLHPLGKFGSGWTFSAAELARVRRLPAHMAYRRTRR